MAKNFCLGVMEKNGSTSKPCTLPVHSAQYQHTLPSTSTLCNVPVHSVLTTAPVHYAIRGDSFTFCLPLFLMLYEL